MIENIPPESLKAIFDSLPVDVTFVDAQDTVRYFNRESNRMFPRPPAAIGRKVQDCHPKKAFTKWKKY